MLIFSSLDLKNYLLKLHHSPENGCDPYLFLDQKRKLGLVKRIKKQIAKFDLTNEELGFIQNYLGLEASNLHPVNISQDIGMEEIPIHQL